MRRPGQATILYSHRLEAPTLWGHTRSWTLEAPQQVVYAGCPVTVVWDPLGFRSLWPLTASTRVWLRQQNTIFHSKTGIHQLPGEGRAGGLLQPLWKASFLGDGKQQFRCGL